MTFDTRDLEAAMTAQYGGYWADLKWAILNRGEVLYINGEEHKVEYVADGPEHADYDSSSALWVVFSVDGEYYRKHGYYQSHYGSEWDGEIERVVPKEVTIIDWESS